MRKIGNVVLIDLKENIDARKQRQLEAQRKIRELEPLRTEFIVINYAKAKDIVSLLRTTGEHSFLTPGRGNVSMDERTNTLIIQDTAEKIAEIRQLIGELDTPVRQVLIESRIVVATSQFSKDLGVKFGYGANQDFGQGNGVVFGGKVSGDTQFSGGTAFTSDNTQTGGQGENFIVNLPALVTGGQPAALGLAIGKIGSYLLQLELSAMQIEGAGEILSSPRIITGNQQEASIVQGTEFAIPGTAGVGAVAAPTFKEAVLELKVTPQITPDERVIMELEVKKNDIIDLTQGSISRREVKTQVLVDNGETIVLGGVYERTKSNKLERVPFFADLPLVGHFFKRRSNRDEKSELLIFVTPKILKEAG
jgi:type IV pilus assembly protein PilQ